MQVKKGWVLKGTRYESCRTEGQCPLKFGRELWDTPCISFAAYQIKEGIIGNIDVASITIIHHVDGIGPKFADLAKGPKEGAIYISDNATEEQRKVLEPFAKTHILAENWRKNLGTKFVPINIEEDNGTYHISMPFGELKISLAVGGDGKTPIRLINPRMIFSGTDITDYKAANTQFWNYRDYGKNIEFRSTSGEIADFVMQGED